MKYMTCTNDMTNDMITLIYYQMKDVECYEDANV